MQEWMLGAITAPEPVSAEEIAQRILPSRTLTPIERMEIYRGMYPLRMVEALQHDFPAVLHFVGEHRFEHLAEDYTQLFPSRSYTFNRLGDRFPEFLAKHTKIQRAYAELARLELAITQVFDEEDVPLLTEIGALDVDSTMPTIPALRLLTFTHDVDALLDAYHDGKTIRAKRAKTLMVVYRRDFAVKRRRLGPRPFAFLGALSAGKTLGEAIALVSPSQDELFAWFRDWNAAGFFSASPTTPPSR